MSVRPKTTVKAVLIDFTGTLKHLSQKLKLFDQWLDISKCFSSYINVERRQRYPLVCNDWSNISQINDNVPWKLHIEWNE